MYPVVGAINGRSTPAMRPATQAAGIVGGVDASLNEYFDDLAQTWRGWTGAHPRRRDRPIAGTFKLRMGRVISLAVERVYGEPWLIESRRYT